MARHAEEELREMCSRELRDLAERLWLPRLRRDSLITRVLEEQGKAEERTRWWDALRNLRATSPFGTYSDHEIIFYVEMASALDPGTAGAEDLEKVSAWRSEILGIARRPPSVPFGLTRSEVLTEVGKHKEHLGQTHAEISSSFPGVPTTGELANYLDLLGGPSSSDPERVAYDVASGLERLRRTKAFEGMSNGKIVELLSERPGNAMERVDDAARCADVLEVEDPKRTPLKLVDSFVEGMRREHEGLPDQEIIEILEGNGGPANFEPPPGQKEPPSPKDSRWWDAMRKVRTLSPYGDDDDEVLVSESLDHYEGADSPRVTPTNLFRLYDRNRHLGVGGKAKVPFELTRSELVVELSKFPEYEDVERVDEAVPREGTIATTKELRKHLDLLGGPSSSSPAKSGSWWEAMRNLRTLEGFRDATDEEIALEAGGSLEELFEKERRKRPASDVAGVPGKLGKQEVLSELSKTPRYQGRPLPKGMSKEEALEHLDLLGGPSSSWSC